MTAGGFLGQLWVTIGVDTSGLATANVAVTNMERVAKGAFGNITAASNASAAAMSAGDERLMLNRIARMDRYEAKALKTANTVANAQIAFDNKLMLQQIKVVNAREAMERKAIASKFAAALKADALFDALATKEMARQQKVMMAQIAAAEKAAAAQAGAFAKATTLMGSSINRMSLAFTRFGTSMSMYLTAPILLIGAAVIKTVSDLDFLQHKIVAFTSTSQEQMNAWIPEIKRISDVTHISSKAITESFYFVANSALSAVTTLKIVELSAKASAAGMGTSADVGKALTFIYNAYGEAAFDAAKSMDILAIAIREGVIEIDQIVPVIGPILPAASALGISFDQVASAVAVMTRTGFNAARSATGFGQMLFALQKPAKGAQDAMKAVGTSFEEMRAIIREQGLIAGLVKIKDLVAIYGETLVGKVFGNIRAFREVLGLIGPQFIENEKVFKKAATESGAFARSWDIATTSVKYSLDGVKIAFQNIFLSIGGKGGGLIIFFDSLSRKLNEVASWFKNLTPAVQQHYIHILLWTAAIGPLVILLGNLIRVIGGLYLAVVWLFTPWTKLIAFSGFLVTAMANVASGYMTLMGLIGITNPWIGAAIAIALVTGALITYFSLQNKVTSTQKAINDVNATAATSIINEKVQIEQLMRVAQSENTSKEQKLAAIKNLNTISPEYLASINQETINTGETTDAINKYTKALGDKAKAKAIEAKMVEVEQTYLSEVMNGTNRKLSFGQKLEYSMYWKNILKGRVDYDNAGKLSDQNEKKALSTKEATIKALQVMMDTLTGVTKAQTKYNDVQNTGVKTTEAQKLALLNAALKGPSDEEGAKTAIEGIQKTFTEGLAKIRAMKAMYGKEIDYSGLKFNEQEELLKIYGSAIEGLAGKMDKSTPYYVKLRKEFEALAVAQRAAATSLSYMNPDETTTNIGNKPLAVRGGGVQMTDTSVYLNRITETTAKYTIAAREATLTGTILGASFDTNSALIKINDDKIKDLVQIYIAATGNASAMAFAQEQINAAMQTNIGLTTTDITNKYNAALEKNTAQYEKSGNSRRRYIANIQAEIEETKALMAIVGISVAKYADLAEILERLQKLAEGPSGFEKFNKIAQEVGTQMTTMITSFTDMVRIQQNKAYELIDSVAKREGKSAEWIAKQKLMIDAAYYKKLKAMAIAQAIINGALAITNIWATTPKADYGVMTFVLSALSAANTLAQIAVISAQGMKSGGVVPSGYNNDTYPALLSSGETVIPARPNALPNFMGGRQTEFRQIRLNVKGRDLEYIFQEQEKLQNAY